MSETLEGLKQDAIQELKEHLDGLDRQERVDFCEDNSGEAGDYMHEIADGQVPVYTAASLELAANNLELALANESGLCGSDASPVEVINVNIYEQIYQALSEWWSNENEEIKERAQGVLDTIEAVQEEIEEKYDALEAGEEIEEHEVEAILEKHMEANEVWDEADEEELKSGWKEMIDGDTKKYLPFLKDYKCEECGQVWHLTETHDNEACPVPDCQGKCRKVTDGLNT